MNWVLIARIVPTVSMVLAIGSAIGWACAGDWRRAMYWAAAFFITLSVTY